MPHWKRNEREISRFWNSYEQIITSLLQIVLRNNKQIPFYRLSSEYYNIVIFLLEVSQAVQEVLQLAAACHYLH